MLSRVIVAAVKSTAGGKAVKRCGVCRDIAKSFHFGGLACDSCKAFFRRSVQNEAFRAFRCAFRARCDITVVSRKCCQHCRFHKCLRIGMEIGWVMTEEERMDMLRSRMEKKQRRSGGCGDARGPDSEMRPAKRRRIAPQVRENTRGSVNRDVDARLPDSCCGQLQDSCGPLQGSTNRDLDAQLADCCGHLEGFSSPHETCEPEPLPPSMEIECLVRGFLARFKPGDLDSSYRHRERSADGNRNPGFVLAMIFVASVRKLVRFARCVGRFAALSPKDQTALLRANAFEMFLALRFGTAAAEEQKCPFLVSVDEGPTFGRRFAASVEDAPTLALLLMVLLFCPDSCQLTDASAVESSRAHFCGLLQVHLNARWGPRKGAALFPRILLLLPTLREMRDKHLSYHFDVGRGDLEPETNGLRPFDF